MINIRLLAHQIGLGTAGTARQWLLDPTLLSISREQCHVCFKLVKMADDPRNESGTENWEIQVAEDTEPNKQVYFARRTSGLPSAMNY